MHTFAIKLFHTLLKWQTSQNQMSIVSVTLLLLQPYCKIKQDNLVCFIPVKNLSNFQTALHAGPFKIDFCNQWEINGILQEILVHFLYYKSLICYNLDSVLSMVHPCSLLVFYKNY